MADAEDILFQVEQSLTREGWPQMNADTLREAHKWINDPETQRALDQQLITAETIAQQVMEALTADGGFVNPRSAPPQLDAIRRQIKESLRARQSAVPLGGS